MSNTNWIESPPKEYKAFKVGDAYAYIHNGARIYANLSMGRMSYVSESVVLGGKYPIVIGSFCSFAPDVYCFTYESHQIDYVSTSPLRLMVGVDTTYSDCVEKPEGVVIGNDVYIGHGVRINPGAKLNDGVVVAARAVVVGELEPYGIYGGVPARLIRKRFAPSIIEALLEIKWWNWSIDRIRRNADFFNLNLAELTDPAVVRAAIKP